MMDVSRHRSVGTLRGYARRRDLQGPCWRRAFVIDAFASMGLSPANRRAGNVIKVPPPASEFRAPPRNAAIMRTTVVTRCGMCVGCSVRAVNAVTVAPGLTYRRDV